MNNLKVKVHKRVLKEVSEKCDGAEDFMNSRIDEICCQEKLSTDKGSIFYVFLLAF